MHISAPGLIIIISSEFSNDQLQLQMGFSRSHSTTPLKKKFNCLFRLMKPKIAIRFHNDIVRHQFFGLDAVT